MRRALLERAEAVSEASPLEAHSTKKFWLALDAAILAEDAPQAIGRLFEHYRPLAKRILSDAERNPLRKLILDRADEVNVNGPLSNYLPKLENYPF